MSRRTGTVIPHLTTPHKVTVFMFIYFELIFDCIMHLETPPPFVTGVPPALQLMDRKSDQVLSFWDSRLHKVIPSLRVSIGKAWWGDQRGGITWDEFVGSGLRLLSMRAGIQLGLVARPDNDVANYSGDDRGMNHPLLSLFSLFDSFVHYFDHSFYRYMGEI
jgi:hypothetical protein